MLTTSFYYILSLYTIAILSYNILSLIRHGTKFYERTKKEGIERVNASEKDKETISSSEQIEDILKSNQAQKHIAW